MSVIAEWRDLKNYLRISHTISNRQGRDINVGETFTLRVIVTNTAPGPSSHGQRPNIRFRNAIVRISGTRYSRPNSGNFVSIPLNDALLTPGDAGWATVEMLALDEIGWLEDVFSSEEVAIITVEADLDQDSFFKVSQHAHLQEEFD